MQTLGKGAPFVAVVLIKAVAMALTEVPELNGFWKDDQHVISEEIHIGFAIALRQGGLITGDP